MFCFLSYFCLLRRNLDKGERRGEQIMQQQYFVTQDYMNDDQWNVKNIPFLSNAGESYSVNRNIVHAFTAAHNMLNLFQKLITI